MNKEKVAQGLVHQALRPWLRADVKDKMPPSGRLLGVRPCPIPKDGIALALRAFETIRNLPQSADAARQSAKIISGRSPYPVVCFPWLHRAFMPDGTPID